MQFSFSRSFCTSGLSSICARVWRSSARACFLAWLQGSCFTALGEVSSTQPVHPVAGEAVKLDHRSLADGEVIAGPHGNTQHTASP